MKRRYSHAEFVPRPKKYYGTLTVDRDHRVRLFGKPVTGQRLVFTRSFFTCDDDAVEYDSDLGTITTELDGKAILLIYLNRRRIVSTTFSFTLAPNELREAAEHLHRAGLTSLIEPGLRYFSEYAPASIALDPAVKADVEWCLRWLSKLRAPPRRRNACPVVQRQKRHT